MIEYMMVVMVAGATVLVVILALAAATELERMESVFHTVLVGLLVFHICSWLGGQTLDYSGYTSDGRIRLVTEYPECQPMTIQPFEPTTALKLTDEFDAFSTIRMGTGEVQLGLRSDGVIVWRRR